MKKFNLILLVIFWCDSINAQNVGIGTTTPHSSAVLDINSTSRGLLVPRMTTAQRLAIGSPTPGLIVYDLSDRQFWIYNSGGWQALLDFSDKYWFKNQSSVPKIYTLDSISVGSITQFEKMNLTDGSFYMRDNRTNRNPQMIFEVPAVNNNQAGIQFKESSNGDTLAAINYYHSTGLGNQLRLGLTNAGANADLVIHSNGNIGLGSLSPQVKLHITAVEDELIRLEGDDPMIRFRRLAGLLTWEDVGFVQTNGTDLRIGTVDGNTTGRFVIRNDGNDLVFVNRLGNMGIGTANTFARLNIADGQDAGLSGVENGYIMLGPINGDNLLFDNNEIQARNLSSTPALLTIQNNGGDFKVGANLLRVNDNGNVGIGTATPTSRLHVVGASHMAGQVYVNNGAGVGIALDGTNPQLQFRQGGTPQSYIQSTNNVNLTIGATNGSIILNSINTGIGTTSPTSRLHVVGFTRMVNTGEVLRIDGVNPQITFSENNVVGGALTYTGPNLELGVTNGKLRLDGQQVAIGVLSDDAPNYKLTVAGRVICEEVKVQLMDDWADYVFDKNYKLPTLDELRAFIAENKHLPNIPSAAAIKANGLELGDMQKRMMEKIEELTLYVLQLENQVRDLKRKNEKAN